MQNKQAMETFVAGLLNQQLPSSYYYHNFAHTAYVTEKAIEIGLHEGCTDEEKELLWVAALWHDSGFTITYNNHEKAGCLLARQHLPGFNYSADQINRVCGIIMATRLPQSPQSKLGAILADADLEYLGAPGVDEKAGLLFRELQVLNPSLTPAQWLKTQISFLQAHTYFTAFCKAHRAPAERNYLARLKQQLTP